MSDSLRDRGPEQTGVVAGSQRPPSFGTFEWDLTDAALTWSPQMYRIHRIARDDFAGTPEDYVRFVHPDDRPALEETIQHLLAGGEPRPVEYRIRCPDGEVRHLLGTNDIIHQEGGRPVRIVGTIRDVTRLRKGGTDETAWVEAALERSEERFRALLENSFDVITVFDSDGTVLYTTPSCRRVLGYEPEELIGRVGLGQLHPDDMEEANRIFQETVARPGAAVTAVHRVRHKDGSYRTVEIHGANLLHHEAVRGMVSNLRDISERQEAIDALRRSEAQYRELVDQAVFGIYRSTLDGRLLSVNPALVEMLGFASRRELLAVNMESLYADPAERARRVREHAGSEPFSIETRWRRKDGQPIMVRLSGRPVASTADLPAGFEGAVEDISGRHALEEALLQSQKMEAVGRLAGGVAHDFNNLLTVILGEVELALASESANGSVGESLKQIRASGERAAALTHKLLAFSRRELVSFEELDLNQLILDVGDMLRRLIEENIELELDLEPELWRIRGDRSQLELLLVNLVVNSRDAMPSGGSLRIRTARTTIERPPMLASSALPPGDYARLQVSDTGHGMSAEVRDHIFEPFFTTKSDKGTGLGLATCYGVAMQHGGDIEATSEPGVGTTVTIHLPRVEDAESVVDAEPLEKETAGSETILLVEDEKSVRDVITRMLEGAGYSVLAAKQADEALGLVDRRGGEIDLLMTDVVLPGPGGPELAEKIRGRLPDLPVLFVTGYTDDSDFLREVGGRDVTLVHKPFSSAELTARVREALDEA